MINHAEIWAYSADMLFLVEQPVVHDAFFPSSLQPYAIETAKETDVPAIREIINRFEGPESAKILERWLKEVPETYNSVYDPAGRLPGSTFSLIQPKCRRR